MAHILPRDLPKQQESLSAPAALRMLVGMDVNQSYDLIAAAAAAKHREEAAS
jgi:hypothetical protein